MSNIQALRKARRICRKFIRQSRANGYHEHANAMVHAMRKFR